VRKKKNLTNYITDTLGDLGMQTMIIMPSKKRTNIIASTEKNDKSLKKLIKEQSNKKNY